jgi:hypothetical protein
MISWALVTLGTSKVYYWLGVLVFATRLTTGSGGETGSNGAPIAVADFTTAGVISRTAYIPVEFPVGLYVRGGTGSTTIKYPAACAPNPLKKLAKGSGTLLRLTYHNGRNPTAIGGDIGFVKGCGDAFGSGSVLAINDTCTSSGCTSYYTTGTALWNDADYIKFTPRAALAPGFTARITGSVEDIWGE